MKYSDKVSYVLVVAAFCMTLCNYPLELHKNAACCKFYVCLRIYYTFGNTKSSLLLDCFLFCWPFFLLLSNQHLEYLKFITSDINTWIYNFQRKWCENKNYSKPKISCKRREFENYPVTQIMFPLPFLKICNIFQRFINFLPLYSHMCIVFI